MSNKEVKDKAFSSPKKTNSVVLELSVQNDGFEFASSIASALDQASIESLTLNETINSINGLKHECDKLDYTLAACSGALCGIIDIFLVGKPNETPIGDITDDWFSNRTKDFAKLCGWEGDGEKSAITFLERKFKIPYDQRGRGDAASFIFDLSPSNHHFKSLAHNPTLCGLFFSVLDQFQNSSHFVSHGKLISLEQADDKFELRGHDFPSKLFCAFVNWFGHLISDMSGSSSGKGRGMGIPSPFWAWTNDIIAIKQSLGLSASQFDESINELALNIYERGYDARFQAAQAIPVFINEMVVRIIYAVRRLFRFFSQTPKEDRSLKLMWQECEPFSNATVKRMLTVAHGTFCVLDIGDATVRGFVAGAGTFNPTEFFLRLNIVGIGRFAISLYGEGKRTLCYWRAEKEAVYAGREKVIIDYYIEGLNILAYKYDDSTLLTFVDDLSKSDSYLSAFQKSAQLAELRNVPPERILRTKADVDAFFRKG